MMASSIQATKRGWRHAWAMGVGKGEGRRRHGRTLQRRWLCGSRKPVGEVGRASGGSGLRGCHDQRVNRRPIRRTRCVLQGRQLGHCTFSLFAATAHAPASAPSLRALWRSAAAAAAVVSGPQISAVRAAASTPPSPSSLSATSARATCCASSSSIAASICPEGCPGGALGSRPAHAACRGRGAPDYGQVSLSACCTPECTVLALRRVAAR